jgi:hypothetical protein
MTLRRLGRREVVTSIPIGVKHGGGVAGTLLNEGRDSGEQI